MNYLAIDTSKKIMSITAQINGKRYNYADESGMHSSTTLMPALDNILKQAGITVKELNCLGVCIGPGSFTGIRIGVTTVKALSYALSIPIVPFNSLEILALQAAQQNAGCRQIIAMTESGNNNIYAAVYDSGGNNIIPPQVFTPSQAEHFLEQYKDKKATVISDIILYKDFFGIKYIQAGHLHDQIAAIMQDENRRADFKTVEPFYILPSQAEINYEKH